MFRSTWTILRELTVSQIFEYEARVVHFNDLHYFVYLSTFTYLKREIYPNVMCSFGNLVLVSRYMHFMFVQRPVR
jgi:hypothetical protein